MKCVCLIVESTIDGSSHLHNHLKKKKSQIDVYVSKVESYLADFSGFFEKNCPTTLLFFEISTVKDLAYLVHAKQLEVQTHGMLVIFSAQPDKNLKKIILEETPYFYLSEFNELSQIFSLLEQKAESNSSLTKFSGKNILVPSLGAINTGNRIADLDLCKTVIDLIPELIYAKDVKSCFVLANQAVADLMGVSSPSDLIGKQDSHFFPVSLWAKYYADEQAIVNGQKDSIYSEEASIDVNTGKEKWLNTSKMPLKSSSGDIVGVVGIGSDITDRKHLQDKLLLLGSIINQSPTVALLVRITEPWTIEYVTENVSLFGYSKESVQFNKSYKELVHPDDFEIVLRNFKQCFINLDTPTIHQYRLQTVGGDFIWVEEISTPGKNEQGEITHMQLIIRDISSRKATETETEQLHNQLLQAQKLEAIGQLATGISHELNTPIQFISDNIAFLEESSTDLIRFVQHVLEEPLKNYGDLKEKATELDLDYVIKEIPKAIEQSLDGANRVSEIVLAMKDFSHPGSNKIQHVDINRALKSTITIAKNEWKYCAKMQLHLADNLPLLPCYPGKLNQAFLNIVVNAAHAIEEKRKQMKSSELGKISIATCISSGFLKITISDSGTGIPKQIQGKVFDPFFTTKIVGKGTGQGLAISFDVITKIHNGKLGFESKEGSGTTFLIKLPLTQDKSIPVESNKETLHL